MENRTVPNSIFNLSAEQLKKYGYMTNPLDEFYLRKNISTDAAMNGDLEYDHSPYSAIFMTTPDCTNITFKGEDVKHDTMENKDFLDHTKNRDGVIEIDADLYSIPTEVRRMLLQRTDNPFIPLITNFFDDTNNIDPPEISLDLTDVGENRFGIKQTLPRNTYGSQTGQTINITYNDISMHGTNGGDYGNLIIMNLHKAWTRYMHDVRSGIISPGDRYSFNLSNYAKMLDASKFLNSKEKADPNTDRSVKAARQLAMVRMKREINYVSTLYYFKLMPDGKTISYWGKWSGLYPKNYGNSAMSSGSKDLTKISIEYQSQFYEDLNRHILESFNMSSFKMTNYTKGLFRDNESNLIINADWTNLPQNYNFRSPFVYFEGGKYKLGMPTNDSRRPTSLTGNPSIDKAYANMPTANSSSNIVASKHATGKYMTKAEEAAAVKEAKLAADTDAKIKAAQRQTDATYNQKDFLKTAAKLPGGPNITQVEGGSGASGTW